ncbi:MAG: SoxR reducing system RseC family protein [Caldisericaceae bacterium]
MRETGVVKSIKGDYAEVRAATASECSSCPLNSSCASTSLRNDETITVINDIGAEVGDIVSFEYNPKDINNGYLIIYGIPTLALIIGFVFGIILEKVFRIHFLPLEDSTTVILTVIFVIASIPVVRFFDSKVKSHFYIYEIIAKNPLKR